MYVTSGTAYALGWCTRGWCTCTYPGRVWGGGGTRVADTSYKDEVWPKDWLRLALGWPGLVPLGWACLSPLDHLRQVSHRTRTRRQADPELYVSKFMNGAVPRSHFTSPESGKVLNLSPRCQYLRGLDSPPGLSVARMVNWQGNSSCGRGSVS